VSGPEVLLIDFSPDKRTAHRLARLLRERGVTVARDIIKRELAGSLAYARAAAIRRAVILGAAGEPPGTVLVHDLTTGVRHTTSLEAFERAVAQGDAPWTV
jgi:histidyl-tRNA synthetase